MAGVTGGSLEQGAEVLRRLSYGSAGARAVALVEREAVLSRSTSSWPAQPSPLLRLAAIAHDLEDGLDEHFGSAPQQLAALSVRDPWTVEPDEAATLRLAALVCLEKIDYRSFVSAYDVPMVLRDALTDPEDLATIAATVRWQSLERMRVATPDEALMTWRRRVALYEREWEGWHVEWDDTLDVRGHLQRYAGVLSGAGQAQWREHIEPIDDAFRTCTERQDIPLALTNEPRPGGWWDYRLPAGAAAVPGWSSWPISPRRYVTRGHGRGLGTNSDVWALAERPEGLRAMTDQELSRWAARCARQAEGLAGLGRSGTSWTVRHERVQHEQQRRAARTDVTPD